MGWFNRILVVDDKTGIVQDITDLDREHYESFLDVVKRLSIAYKIAREKEDELQNLRKES